MRNILTVILFVLISGIVNATNYYVATGGSDSNPGTIGSPYLTWAKGCSALVAGDTCFIRGGTYTSPFSSGAQDWLVTIANRTGNSSHHVVVCNYPGEQPVFDLTGFNQTNNTTCIRVNKCSFTDFIGLWVKNMQQNVSGNIISGWDFHECTDIQMIRCWVHNIAGAGIRQGQPNGLDVIRNNRFTYINCDASWCADAISTGGGAYGNADGFDADEGVALYRNCRAWWNSDDGFDFSFNDSTVTIDSCQSFRNGYEPGTFINPGAQADGMGFKWAIGSNADRSTIVTRIFTRCISFDNKAAGYDQNAGKVKAEFFNCDAYRCPNGWQTGWGIVPRVAHILKNNIAFSVTSPVTDTAGLIMSHNTWNGFPASSSSFASLDTTGISGARQSDGSLPNLQFLHLSSASNMIDIGVVVGLTGICGIAPDLGAYEYCGGGGTPLAFTYTATPILCNGNSSTINISATGGQPSYQYSIGAGAYQTSNVFTTVAGTFILNVKDATGTIVSTTAVITQPSAMIVTEKHGTILVNGNTTGDTVTATGGTTPYQYSMDAAAFQSSNFFTLAAGNHTVIVKDANSCTKSLSFTITQPSVLAVSLSASSITCNGGASTITATASGGTTPYHYKIGAGSFQTSNLFTGQTAGTYTVTVQDAAGALVSSTITITQPTVISISLSFGTAPATVTVTSGGGVGTLNYLLDAGTYQTSNVFTGVAAGTHTITVRDANLCTNTKSFTVVLSPLRVSLSVGTITCNGGSATATATPSGGTSPYTYRWSNGITTSSTTLPFGTDTLHVADAGSQVFDTSFVVTQPAAIGVSVAFGTAPTTVTVTATNTVGTVNYQLDAGAFQTSNTFLNVASGTHTVTVRDANLCTAIKTFTVTTGSTPLSISLAVTTPILCNGSKTGAITATPTGGTGPYQYKLSQWASFVSSNVISNLGASSPTVIVKDALGATASAIITITQPTAIGVAVAFGSAPATVVVTATNAVGTPQYKLDAGAYQLSNTFSNVAGGTHTVTVIDGNSCIKAKSFTVLTSGMSVSLSVGTIGCNGGTASATATPSGGIAPYFYLWSNNQTTATATGLTAGTKTLHVTDNASHVFDTSFVITQPSAISVSVGFTVIGTHGGTSTVTVTASGGVPALTYSLDGGSYQGSNSFTGVLAGNHTMDVKDANGCIIRKSFSITQPGNLIIHVAQLTVIDCYLDSASMGVTATGGTPPYVGVDTFNVAAGTRTYTVTDAFGARADSIVTVTQPSIIIVTVRTGTITVNGGSTYVKILGTGGTGSYTFQLDASGYSSTDSILGVHAGTHTAYVKDANGCIWTYTFTLTQPSKHHHLFVPAAILYNKDWFVGIKRRNDFRVSP